MMDGWEQHRCIMKAMAVARETLGVGVDTCRATSRKPTWWSKLMVTMSLPGGWDDLDQREWEERCINRHVAVYENDCRVGTYLCRIAAMQAAS